MNLLEKYYNQIIKIDFVNKYFYETLTDVPKIKKIILNFGCKKLDLFVITSSLLFLELIVKKKAKLAKAKKSNVLLKIRKGNIVGCKVVLKKSKMYRFLLKLIVSAFPNIKNFDGIKVFQKNLLKTSFSFTLKYFDCFNELEKQFYLFSKLPPLNITIISNTKTEEELLFLLQSFKLPLVLKISDYNSIGRVLPCQGKSKGSIPFSCLMKRIDGRVV